ncbi:Fasciclin domain-containing protein [Biscogniauxia mediterranea]|nr:Fasciclin domain-containing protein [Biscogniauxia mediterranea]
MRYTTLLPFVVTAVAVVIPDEVTANQLVLETEQQQQPEKSEKTPYLSSWWGDLTSFFDDLRNTADETFALSLDFFEGQISKAGDVLPEINLLPPSAQDISGDHHHPPPGHHRLTNLTVYQAIKASNFTKRFAALVDEFPDIVESLNSTEANSTLFVPLDKAFEKIPHHGDGKPPKEFLEKVVKYHILPGYFPAGRVVVHRTLPTALESKALGDRPQRLRVSLGLFGVRINFYSTVKVVNIFSKNGVIHAVDSILVPPPPAAKLISLFPTKFSTLELAAEKTGFTHHRDHDHDHDGDDNDGKEPGPHHHHHHKDLTGLTVFAPTNTAFQRLGPAANAFLFNSPRGLHYLRALLAYHVVANETLYSDAYYKKLTTGTSSPNTNSKGGEEEVGEEGFGKRYHVDLATLLGGRPLGVDIVERWLAPASFVVNGRVGVALRDGVAADGVVHVVNSVLVPPRKPGRGYDEEEEEQGEISVEELVERLAPYVDLELEGEGEGEKKEEWQEEEEL